MTEPAEPAVSEDSPQLRLPQRVPLPPRRNLVFTSAGDRSNAHRWLKGRRNFDLWITYYGDEPGRLSDIADFYNVRRDSKFGNLKFAYETWPDWLAPYESILVTDDDIIISGAQISRLFELREALDLWVAQAAFSPLGKISWDVTRVQPRCRFRYTNFIEMTCPLFRKDKLDAFMAAFDPVLKGTGADWWFMQSLGPDIEGKVAMIDSITCVNPFDRTKGKGRTREIDRLQPMQDRTAVWSSIRSRYGIEERQPAEYGRTLKPVPWRWLSTIAHWPIDRYVAARKTAHSRRQALRGSARNHR